MEVGQEAGDSSGVTVLERVASGVAVLHLGTPGEKVVTLTAKRIESLKKHLQEVRSTPPKGLVIIGPSPEMFTVGADISIIRSVVDATQGAELARRGQEVFDILEALPFTTVAAISGPCVGGGCELVLACKYRIITDHRASQIGLPETKLGILPGFGGTQRLPRLVGLPKALDIILAGKTLRPEQALRAGLVDRVVSPDDLRDRAESIAEGLIPPPKRQRRMLDTLLTFTPLRGIVARQARKQVKRQTKGFYPAPLKALDCAVYGLAQGQIAGLAKEAKELGRLIVTPECKALTNIFFLTEQSKSLGKSGRKLVENLHSCVLGAGVMGAGIAGLLAKNESTVVLRDPFEEALNRGLGHIDAFLRKLSYLREPERRAIRDRIEPSTGMPESLSKAGFVIEAVFEDLNVKRKVLGEIAERVPADAILATNTSSLSVQEVASELPHPERVVGMHFFNPVEKMPLIEIIRADNTSDRAIALVAALSVKLGKFPIVVDNVPGFLVNRILSPYLVESAYLLQEGYEIADIDKAARSFGMPMGPIRLLDEVGLDVAAHVSEILIAGYGDRMRGPQFAKTLCELGRKGKKNSLGFYDFTGEKERPEPNIRQLLKIDASAKTANRTEITDRLVLALINEAVRCLDEGVAGQAGREAASQVDLGSVMGFGFPPFRGGILYYADTIGAPAILGKLRTLEQRVGPRFAPAPGIESRAATGAAFHG